MRRAIVAAIFGIFSSVGIFVFNGRLIEDTFLYARGDAAWSSPIMAGIGAIAGLPGVRGAAIGFAILLGWQLGRSTMAWILTVLIFPWGHSIGMAGADSAGAWGTVAARNRGFYVLPFIAALHLEAALVSLCTIVGRRMGFRQSGTIAILAGIGACIAQRHIQARYLLPGFSLAAIVGVQRLSHSRQHSHPSTA
jgi:hypothetical protein